MLSRLRERVETTFSHRWSRLVECVYARSRNGLWNSIKLKMLPLNLSGAWVISA
jgi:hypothetical protein